MRIDQILDNLEAEIIALKESGKTLNALNLSKLNRLSERLDFEEQVEGLTAEQKEAYIKRFKTIITQFDTWIGRQDTTNN